MAEELYGNELMVLHEQCITNTTCSELESYNVNADEVAAQLSERTDKKPENKGGHLYTCRNSSAWAFNPYNSVMSG